MNSRARQDGFTLLEVMIAMSILAVGAASVLGIFVAAVQWHSQRVEDNRITRLYNFARQHAQNTFNSFDPSKVTEGHTKLPKTISADLTNTSQARQSSDPLIREAADKFPGFKYEIRWEANEFAVGDSSVVADIIIYGLSGERDDSLLATKEILTRSGTPIHEFFTSPSMEKRKKDRGPSRDQ
ncbi:MAG: type IV pilus modification PilV family protein [Planctomycetota bacterium]|jgi:prepilin-type N-terminal cleavage/methylation domain-containing protein